VLATQSSRTAFLTDPSHRIRFVFTPKHCSWINQIEIWFSILVRRLLNRSSFKHTLDMQKQLSTTSTKRLLSHSSEPIRAKLFVLISSDSNDLSDGLNGLLDFAHLAATTESYISSPFVPDFWTGWGADLATAMVATTTAHNNNPNESIQDIADSLVGDVNSPFNYSDICTDADAIKIAALVRENPNITTHALSNALNIYFTTHIQDRYLQLVKDVGAIENLTSLKEHIYDKMNGIDEGAILLRLKGNSPSEEVNRAACNAFANYIYSELD